MSSKLRIFSTFIVVALVSAPAHAIQFDGFFTVGAATNDDKNKNTYISSLGDRGITEDITFETDTRFGLQMTSDVSEDMSVIAQLLGTGTSGNFDAIIEWAYVDYEFADWLSVHAGKIKQPVYLVNDYVEVGYAYPWIRPPVEVYYLNNPLNTVNGMELLFSFSLGPGRLSFQPYIGSNRDDIPNTGGTGYFEAENIYGIDVKYAGRSYTVHASNFTCDVKTFGNLTGVPTDPGYGIPGNAVDINLNGKGQCKVSAAGLNLDIANVVVYAEWQERTTKDTLSRAFGDQTAWYTTFGYRIGKWLPHLTFASIDGESSIVTDTTGAGAITIPAVGGPPWPAGTTFNFPVAIQTSVTAGLRYEVNDSAALKVEYSLVDVENDPAELAKAKQGFNFGLFNTDFTKFAPTEKVGITSIALDVIF